VQLSHRGCLIGILGKIQLESLELGEERDGEGDIAKRLGGDGEIELTLRSASQAT
jgi:hypothetical protein